MAHGGEHEQSALDDAIRAERMRLMVRQSAPPLMFSPLGAVVLATALWHTGHHLRLSLWAGGVIAIGIGRVLLMRAYPKAASATREIKTWERAFVATALLVSLWWGLGALALLTGERAEDYMVFAFLMLMAGGASASYSAHPLTVMVAVAALALPITLRFAFHGDVASRAMALAAVMYFAAALRAIRTLAFFFVNNQRLARELKSARDSAEQLARIDHLTGLNNRRAFYELCGAALQHAERYRHPSALILIDIDDFKSVNDRFGHAAGDEVIRTLAALIREHCRQTDIAGRLGGDELAILLPETSAVNASATAERLRQAAQARSVLQNAAPVRFTLSLGIATWSEGQTLDTLLANADAALYDAKRGGRNSARVQVSEAAPQVTFEARSIGK